MPNFLKIIIDAIRGKEKNFTEGGINRAIVLLAIPMILEMVMEALFALVDTYFVSKVSVEAITTIGLTEAVITLVYSMGIGLSTAATAMIARRVGEGKTDKAAEATVQAILLALAVAVILGFSGALFAEEILLLMGASPQVLEEGTNYTRIMFATNGVILFIFLLNGVFRGAGDAYIAMQVLWLSNGLNIILDPLLIFGWGPIPAMGVTGAAIATSIGRGVGVGLQLYILFGKRGVVSLRNAVWRVNKKVMAKLGNVAATGTGQFLIASASWIFLMRIIAVFGDEAVAGYVIAIRLIIFTLLPSWGVANAAATLVGQNLGAKQPERAELSVWRSAAFNMVFLAVVSIFYFTTAPYLIPLFNTTPTVVEIGALSLRVLCTGYVFFAYGMVISQAFNGAGDTRTPTLINFVCFWMIEIPLGYALAITYGFEVAGVCAAVAIAETVMAIICVVLFRRGYWKTVEI